MAILLLALTWNGSKAPGAAGEAAATGPGVIFAKQQSCGALPHAQARWAGTAASGRTSTAPSRTTTLVLDRVTNGKGGMPAFKGELDEKQINCLAIVVSSITNGGSSTSAGTGGAREDLA